MLLSRYLFIQKTYFIAFIVFMFFSVIFCNISQVNLLFHFSLIVFVSITFFTKIGRADFFNDPSLLKILCVPIVFFAYYSATNLWSSAPENITSAIKHSIYLLGFLCIYRQAEKNGYKKYVVGAVFFGIIFLAILTIIFTDKSKLSWSRLKDGFPWAPDNVIDLGGYMVVGIYCGLIYIRETGKNILYIFLPFMFIVLLLTQSRGPLLAFLLTFLLSLFFKPRATKKSIYILLAALLVTITLILTTDVFDYIIHRLERTSQSTDVRMNIWLYAFNLTKEHLYFGLGYNKILNYINASGGNITTTHSIYFGAILKGGVIGLILLLSLIGTGALTIKNHLSNGQKLEAFFFLFCIIYYSVQGMFIIGNPQEFWYLFWLPLAIVLSTPIKKFVAS